MAEAIEIVIEHHIGDRRGGGASVCHCYCNIRIFVLSSATDKLCITVIDSLTPSPNQRRSSRATAIDTHSEPKETPSAHSAVIMIAPPASSGPCASDLVNTAALNRLAGVGNI